MESIDMKIKADAKATYVFKRYVKGKIFIIDGEHYATLEDQANRVFTITEQEVQDLLAQDVITAV